MTLLENSLSSCSNRHPAGWDSVGYDLAQALRSQGRKIWGQNETQWHVLLSELHNSRKSLSHQGQWVYEGYHRLLLWRNLQQTPRNRIHRWKALLRSLALNLFGTIILATYLVWIIGTSWLFPALMIPPFPTLNDLCWKIFLLTLSEDFLFSSFCSFRLRSFLYVFHWL